MHCNWLFWYTCCVQYFIWRSILFNPILAYIAKPWQLVAVTVGSPAYLGWKIAYDLIYLPWQHTRFKARVLTLLLIGVALGGNIRLQNHLTEHTQWRMSLDRRVAESPADLFLNAGFTYEDHLAPAMQERLPLEHQVEHHLISVLHRYQVLASDAHFTGYDLHRQLKMAGVLEVPTANFSGDVYP